MGTAWVECWKCDACGHRWIKGELYPAQCSKCRSRKWDNERGAASSGRTPAPERQAGKEGSIPFSPTKSSMDDLRAICAGNVPSSVYHEPEPEPEIRPLCKNPECEKPMTQVKFGKWACADVSCPRYGVEVK